MNSKVGLDDFGQVYDFVVVVYWGGSDEKQN